MRTLRLLFLTAILDLDSSPLMNAGFPFRTPCTGSPVDGVSRPLGDLSTSLTFPPSSSSPERRRRSVSRLARRRTVMERTVRLRAPFISPTGRPGTTCDLDHSGRPFDHNEPRYFPTPARSDTWAGSRDFQR